MNEEFQPFSNERIPCPLCRYNMRLKLSLRHLMAQYKDLCAHCKDKVSYVDKKCICKEETRETRARPPLDEEEKELYRRIKNFYKSIVPSARLIHKTKILPLLDEYNPFQSLSVPNFREYDTKSRQIRLADSEPNLSLGRPSDEVRKTHLKYQSDDEGDRRKSGREYGAERDRDGAERERDYGAGRGFEYGAGTDRDRIGRGREYGAGTDRGGAAIDRQYDAGKDREYGAGKDREYGAATERDRIERDRQYGAGKDRDGAARDREYGAGTDRDRIERDRQYGAGKDRDGAARDREYGAGTDRDRIERDRQYGAGKDREYGAATDRDGTAREKGSKMKETAIGKYGVKDTSDKGKNVERGKGASEAKQKVADREKVVEVKKPKDAIKEKSTDGEIKDTAGKARKGKEVDKEKGTSKEQGATGGKAKKGKEVEVKYAEKGKGVFVSKVKQDDNEPDNTEGKASKGKGKTGKSPIDDKEKEKKEKGGGGKADKDKEGVDRQGKRIVNTDKEVLRSDKDKDQIELDILSFSERRELSKIKGEGHKKKAVPKAKKHRDKIHDEPKKKPKTERSDDERESQKDKPKGKKKDAEIDDDLATPLTYSEESNRKHGNPFLREGHGAKHKTKRKNSKKSIGKKSIGSIEKIITPRVKPKILELIKKLLKTPRTRDKYSERISDRTSRYLQFEDVHFSNPKISCLHLLNEPTPRKYNYCIVGNRIIKYKASMPKFPELEEYSISVKPRVYVKYEEKPAQIGKDIMEIRDDSSANDMGVLCYSLSDRSFISKGYTILPTEKIMRKPEHHVQTKHQWIKKYIMIHNRSGESSFKNYPDWATVVEYGLKPSYNYEETHAQQWVVTLNVYRMRPSNPHNNWFARNRRKKRINYCSGQKLAVFEGDERCRIYYKNGNVALDYYQSEDPQAKERIVLYSDGENELKQKVPVTVLATFDHMGTGVIFDKKGNVRAKYNQNEGVVLDRTLGPYTKWKWHKLNDPPVLEEVMMDTMLPIKDPRILRMYSKEQLPREVDEKILEIEFQNSLREKGKKIFKSFKPFPIKMKAFKINDQFSLHIMDQTKIYLSFRDGSTSFRIDVGMILDCNEIIDTETMEMGEVDVPIERRPARTSSLQNLQRSVEQAKLLERKRYTRSQRQRPTVEPCRSLDRMRDALSPPPRVHLQGNQTVLPCDCRKDTI